jgi:predicted phosphodiesterase
VIVPVGSDWFNVDNPWNETANGTRQDMDGTYAQMIMEGTELAVEYIDLLRQIAPVSIITVDGNHDRSSALTMGMYLRAWYRNMPDVTCVVKPSPRQYVEYGNSLLGFCHGDDIKVGQLPALMASEARESWGRTQLRNWFTGHLHHEVTRDLDGVTQYQLPSLAGADRWSSRKGFCLSKRALTAYVIDHEVGNRAVLTSPILKEIPYGFKMPGTSYRTTAA